MKSRYIKRRKKVSLHYNFRNNNCVSAGNGFYLSCNTRQFKGIYS